MKRRQVIGLGWALVLLAGVGAAEGQAAERPRARVKGQNYAFLVAAGDYDLKELKPLKYPRGDILAFSQTLRECGFPKDNIILMHDQQQRRYLPEAAKIRTELKLLLARVEDDDTLVVALSGHGVQFKAAKGQQETPYFCPVDAQLADRTTLLGLDDLYKRLKGCKARRKLLIVDACRNDPQSRLAKSRAEVDLDELAGLQKLPVPRGIVALFSCSAGEQSWEHPDLKHGVFFHYLLKGWKGEANQDGDGTVTLDELAAYVKKQTQKYVHLKLRAAQRPELKGEFSDWVVRAVDPATRAYQQGEAALAEHHYGRAIARFSEAIRRNANHAAAYRGRAWASIFQADFVQTVADYTEALRLEPASVEAQVGRGWAYRFRGDRGRATADFQAALLLPPSRVARNCFFRGMACYCADSRHGYDQAIALFSEAIRLDPHYADAYVSRGHTFLATQDNGRAMADFTQAMRLDPRFAEPYNGRGLVYRNQGKIDRAIACYSEALLLNSKLPWVYRNRGNAYCAQRQWRKALADFNRALRLNPRDSYAFSGRAWAHNGMKQYSQVIADCTKALRLDARNAWAFSNRGFAYHVQGRYGRAIADYTEAIRLDSQESRHYQCRADSYEALQDYARARADRAKARRLARSP